MEEKFAVGISIIFLHQVPKSGIKMQDLQHHEGKKKKKGEKNTYT